MKRHLAYSVLILALIAVWGCSKSSKSAKSVTMQLPWLNAEGTEYEKSDVEVKTLSDVHRLEGSAAQIFWSAPYDVEQNGFAPKSTHFRFVKSGEVYIPADVESLQAATVYAHFDRLIEFDKKTGVYEKLPRPRRIGIDIKIAEEENEILVNNAFYDPRTDVFVIVPYESEHLPITVNAGIIAHEHFHSIFQRIVNDVIAKGEIVGGHVYANEEGDEKRANLSYKDFNRQVILRAVNEGLADLWAWIYSGDTDFVGRSIPKLSDLRRLDRKALLLPQTDVLYKAMKNMSDNEIRSRAYEIGVQYARLFRQIAESSDLKESQEQRIEIAKKVIKAMEHFAVEAKKVWNDGGKISPQLIVESFVAVNPEFSASSDNCQLLSNFNLSKSRTKGVCK